MLSFSLENSYGMPTLYLCYRDNPYLIVELFQFGVFLYSHEIIF